MLYEEFLNPIICLTLIVLLLSVLFKTKLISLMLRGLKAMNSSYKKSIQSSKKTFYVFFILIFFEFIVAYCLCKNYFIDKYNIGDFLAFVFLFIICFIIVYFLLGIPLVLFERIENILLGIKNKYYRNLFQVNLMILVFIVISDFTINYFSNPYWILTLSLLLVIVVFVLNFRILLIMVHSPSLLIIKESNTLEKRNRKTLIEGTVLLLFMIIADFSLATYLVNMIYNGDGYEKKIKNFVDCIYYVAISFTTIGYGDIAPTKPGSRILAIVISITSVICLVILINVIMSHIDHVMHKESTNVVVSHKEYDKGSGIDEQN